MIVRQFSPATAPVMAITPTGLVNDNYTNNFSVIQDALATGVPVQIPHGNYRVKGDSLDLLGNELIGANWGYSATLSSNLIFSDIPTGKPAIKTSIATQPSGRIAGLYRLNISANDWTTITGHGLDIEAPIDMQFCVVHKFKKSNMILHWNGSTGGPWQSFFLCNNFLYAGEHGVVAGAGAGSTLWFSNHMHWNGSPSFGTAPSVAGSYDGFKVDGTETFGGLYTALNVEGMYQLGGDQSYNSRYGWNYAGASGCRWFPNYSENNLGAASYYNRLGIVTNCILDIGLAPLVNPFKQDNTIIPGCLTTSVWRGGEYLGCGDGGTYSQFFKNVTNLMLARKDANNYVQLLIDNATGDITFSRGGTAKVKMHGLATYADNATAKAAGLVADDEYVDATGHRMVVY